MPDDRVTPSTYDQDFDSWTQSQAAALRAVAEALARGEVAPDARLLALDWGNLAEEIESLGKRDRRELGSRLDTIIEHLVKLEFSRHTGPRGGWLSTVNRERGEIAMILEDSPSLRRLIPSLIGRRVTGAISAGIAGLGRHGETVDTSARRAAGYTPDQVIGDWLPDAPCP